MTRNKLSESLPSVVDKLVESIKSEPRMQHLNRIRLPSRDNVVHALALLRELAFPGYFGKQGLTADNVAYHVGELTIELADLLFDEVRCSLRYREQIPEANGAGGPARNCDETAARIVADFFEKVPQVRATLATDVQAAFDGDPAARNTDETIFCYPGLHAIFVQRFAHELFKLDVPLLPRIMTEHAHSLTGIDIHPGAKLGPSFFIDHGTGVVVGETTEIGRNVKLYQGVTLGAIAPHFGQMLRGEKRHPTIEDDVTIYSGATILGGNTVIGRGAVIGGNVFITSSVPALTQVSTESPKLRYRERRKKGVKDEFVLDFSI